MKEKTIQDIGIFSREDRYLYAIATGDLSVLPKETHSRVERYYELIAKNGSASGEHIHHNMFVLSQLTQEHIDSINTIFEEVQG
jgi:hypothetical protein